MSSKETKEDWTKSVVASDPTKRTYEAIERELHHDIKESNNPATIRGDNGDRAYSIAVDGARAKHELLRNHELDMVTKGVITNEGRKKGKHHSHSMGAARNFMGTRTVKVGENVTHVLRGGRKRKRKTRKRKIFRKRKTKRRKKTRKHKRRKRRKTRKR